MEDRSRWRYICGILAAAGTALLVFAVFTILGRTDKTDLYLSDSQTTRHGWRYEVLLDDGPQPYEPVFTGDYILALPEGTHAVRVTRTMTEDIPNAELVFMTHRDGVEIFLDGELIYSDFSELSRDADGFVHPGEEQWARLEKAQGSTWRQVRMSLPQDYSGQQLTMITYYPEGEEATAPEFPFLGNEDTYVATIIVISVRYAATMTIYAILALLVAGMYLLDVHNKSADGKTLLLCLYFLLLFLNGAYHSDAGYYSDLARYLNLRFLSGLYMMPLYLYLALRLKSRWKWLLCAGIGALSLYEGAQQFLLDHQGLSDIAGSTGPGSLVVFLAVAVAYCAEGFQPGGWLRQQKRRLIRYGLLAAAVTAAYLADRVHAWGSVSAYLLDGIWNALTLGDFWPVVNLCADIISYIAVIVIVAEAVHRTIEARRTMDVLQERGRQTMESYGRLLATEDATNALHHELRHHMTSLSAILASGDLERARSYVDAVSGDLERLPVGRYSRNILVNVLVGSYLDQARAQGIRVEHQLNVPPELNIADEDLSVFLSNMLQNALEACERMGTRQERYIRLDMYLQGKFLFIRCVNSAPDEDERRERPRHGYGLAAMRAVAEKYDSMLVMEHERGKFLVMSNLCLRER